MEKMVDILIDDIERLQEINQYFSSVTILISDSDMETTSSEHEELKQINNYLYNFSEMIQAIIDRKEDQIQVLKTDDVIAEQTELRNQIYNQK